VRNLLEDLPGGDLHGAQMVSREWVASGDLRGREVLDIGCGFGWFEIISLEAGATRIAGIEPDETDLATARCFFDHEHVSFHVGSATEIPFPDQSFDTVVCWEVLEHIPKNSEPRAFAEIARVLKPGGVFYMSTPYAAGFTRVTDPAYWLIGHRHYTKRQLAGFARGAGLEVEDLMVRGDHWHNIAINNLYVAKWIFRREPFLADRVNRRLDAGYRKPGGFATAFMKCRAADGRS
jgi:SAM-dependent methyltransferase